MSLLDSVLSNPQIANAAKSLLSANDTSVGNSAGLAGILGSLESSGLGDVVSSWLGSGPNKAVDPARLQAALGDDTVSSFAKGAGIDVGKAAATLAAVLPSLVDQLSPQGRVPEPSGLDQVLGGLLGSLTKGA